MEGKTIISPLEYMEKYVIWGLLLIFIFPLLLLKHACINQKIIL